MRIPGFFAAIAVVALVACGPQAAGPPTPPAPGGPIKSDAKAGPTSGYRLETVATGLEYPWSAAWLPDGTMLVTEKTGALRAIRNGALEPAPISGAPGVHFSGQGGMFDVLPHPQFAENGLIYLSYAVERPGPGGGRLNATAIARGRLSGNALLDVSEIYVRNPLRPGGMHYGGRMLFLPDGSLLLTLGDGYRFREEAQDKAGQLGKTVRMTDAGAPAPDNPFASDAAADPFVYSLGHRNIQGAALDRATGRVYLHEHGPLGGDEINVLKAGVNYGWPVITYGKDYNGATISPFTQRPGMAQPILHWTPSIAPSGLAFYDGALFPQWRGDLFAGGLKDGLVHRIDLDGEGRVLAEETLFAEIGARIRDVRQGPDGALYVLTDELDGRIIRVVPAA